ncbi:MAG: AI-2E family transporter [Actinomycetaceae bacterium]|nr:AI-2E family transporter [Actinomycetaceae bacterium]
MGNKRRKINLRDFAAKARGQGRKVLETAKARKTPPEPTGHAPKPVTRDSFSRSQARTELRASSRGIQPRFSHHTKPDNGNIPAWLRKAGTASWMIIGILIIVAIVVWGLAKIAAVFGAVFIALVVTSVLNPIVARLERYMPRWLGVLIALLGSTAVVGGLLTYVVTSVAGQWNTLSRQFGNGVDKIIEFVRTGPWAVELTTDEVYEWLNQTIAQARNYIETNAGSLAQEALSNLGTVAIGFTVLALALFTTIFFLHSGEQMWRWFLNRLPQRHRSSTHRAAAAGWFTFSGYARGIMLVAFTNGIFAFIYLTILGIPLAAPLGVLVFIGSFIPLIGAPSAMVIAMIVALAAEGVWTMIFVGIGIALIGQFEGHVLQPLIMGSQVSLHPVVVGIGVTAGTLLAGLFGAVISIPIIASTWAIYQQLRDEDPPYEGELPSAREVGEGTEDPA